MKEKPDYVPAGIPSKYSLCFDMSKDTKEFRIQDILALIFPPRYQPQQFKISHTLLTLLLKKQTLETKDLGELIEKHNFSRSTLYGKVIPKLERFGLVKKEVCKGKGKPINLMISGEFANLLHNIASSWEFILAISKAK